MKVKNPLIVISNDTNISNGQVDGIRFDSDSVKLAQEKKKEEQLGNSNGVVQKNLGSSNISESLQSKEGQNQKIHDDSRNSELKDKVDDSGKNIGGSGEVSESKSEDRMDGNEESNGSLLGLEKEKLRDDECDPSNMCVDPKNNLTACLRVPGNGEFF